MSLSAVPSGPLEIHGRTRYASQATTTVTVRRHVLEDPLLIIHGGLIERRNNGSTFVLSAKHLSATDEEHDSAYVAWLDGVGLTLESVGPRGVTFTGAILEAKYYLKEPEPEDVEECTWQCGEVHGTLPFTPPQQRWKPDAYTIEIRYVAEAPEADEDLSDEYEDDREEYDDEE